MRRPIVGVGRRVVLAAVLMQPVFACALDHDNLDPNRPIAIEDAYAIPKGEIGVEAGARIEDRRQGPTRISIQPQIIYGAFYNAQLELQGNLFSHAGTIVGSERSGDFHIGLLYNFNTETTHVPAFAVRAGVEFPTGQQSQGVDQQYTGILTKSFGRLRTHLNVGYTVLGAPQGQERPGTYRAIAAVSYPLGYPTSFLTTGILGVYTRQSDIRGQRNPTGVEAGLRRQLTSRVVIDAGLGTELYGPADRIAVMGTMGLSLGF
ncbi:MAG TPA: transporter [Nitrospira sp.]|nr:transporter [Nitrospira sp.]